MSKPQNLCATITVYKLFNQHQEAVEVPGRLKKEGDKNDFLVDLLRCIPDTHIKTIIQARSSLQLNSKPQVCYCELHPSKQ